MNNKFDVEKYLNSLPDNVNIIDVSKKNLNYLPDLLRFKKLKVLICSYNKLTSLPVLPKNLKELYCYNNKLTSLPILPENLKWLNCSYNKLISLPILPENLKGLFYFCNPIRDIILYDGNINTINKNIIIWNNFQHLFYCLKYRKIFLKMMEPIIKKRYHPSYLYDLKEDDDLDKKLDGW